MLASARTTFGALPPSSSATLRSPSAARFITRMPVAVSPVKAIMSTPSWPTSTSPTVAPAPSTHVSTPSGSPGCAASSASASTVIAGVMLAGFTTVALPAASAGTSERTSSVSGQFQGVITATTPTGSRRTTPVTSSPSTAERP